MVFPVFVLTVSYRNCAADESYVVTQGDTLSSIADVFYSDASQWKLIFEANRDKLKDPHDIRPQQVLILPGVSEPEDDVEALLAKGTTDVAAPQVKPEVLPIPLASVKESASFEPKQKPALRQDARSMPASMPVRRPSVRRLITDYDGKIIASKNSDRDMYGQGDRVVVNLGSKDGLVVGDMLLVVKKTDQLTQKQNKSGQHKKDQYFYKELGSLKIMVVDESSADGDIIMSRDPIFIGDGVLK